MIVLLPTLTLLISSTLACAPHKPLQSSRPSVPSRPNPNPDPNPDPNPNPEPGTNPGPAPPSTKLIPEPETGCPILSPDIAKCIEVFSSLGESSPSSYCAHPLISSSTQFVCPSQQPVMLVFDENTVIDMYSSIECESSTGTWIFSGEAEKRRDELKSPITVTCVNPYHTGNNN